MDKKILKITTLEIYACLNMQQPREEHDEVRNATKDNRTIETIEELEKLRQNLEDKRGNVMEIGEEQDILLEQPKTLI